MLKPVCNDEEDDDGEILMMYDFLYYNKSFAPFNNDDINYDERVL